MTYLENLEKCSKELTAATETLLDHGKDSRKDSIGAPVHDAPVEVQRARRSIPASVTKLQMLLSEPSDFIQNLASQTQVLACLRWLGEFQVMVCIPLSGSIATRDVADMAGVSEARLCRVVRLMQVFGFLREPEPGHVGHTPLSARFVTVPSYLDAAMFLAETAAPSALHMSAVTTQSDGEESAYGAAFNTAQPFHLALMERNRLQRQWYAYRRCTGDVGDSIPQLLSRLDWSNGGNACFIDACEESITAVTALVEMYPATRVIVQVNDSASPVSIDDMAIANDVKNRIAIQQRSPGVAQNVKDAALYIMRPSPPVPFLHARVLAELQAHIGILRANTSATLVLAPPLLPEPGAAEPNAEALARLHDLSHLQLTNEGAIELCELLDIVQNVHDGDGRLVVTNKLRSCNTNATVAIGVKYHFYSEGLADPAIMM